MLELLEDLLQYNYLHVPYNLERKLQNKRILQQIQRKRKDLLYKSKDKMKYDR